MDKIGKLLQCELKVINTGLEMFYQDLKHRAVKTVNVDWRPPVAKKNLNAILQKIKAI